MLKNMPSESNPPNYCLATREQIANHFQVSPRTIGSWMRRRILPYIKIRNLVRFDVAECDEAFEHFEIAPKRDTRIVVDPAHQRHWQTKYQIATRLQISLRSVTNLMSNRMIPYVKIGHLVRLDTVRVDAAMQAFRERSLLG